MNTLDTQPTHVALPNLPTYQPHLQQNQQQQQAIDQQMSMIKATLMQELA